MKPSHRSLPLLLLAAALLDACASAPPPAPPVAVEHPRRRRRRAAATAPSDAPVATPDAARASAISPDASAEPVAASDGLSLVPTVRRVGSLEPRPNAPSMGSPVVPTVSTGGRPLTARWTGPRSAPRIVCEGDGTPQRPSTQSPYDPTNAMIVRTFLPAESSVIACAPAVDGEGRVSVRVLFAGNGLPQEVSLSAGVSRVQGLCLGAALCNTHMSAFRAPNATVSYAFVVAVAAEETATQTE